MRTKLGEQLAKIIFEADLLETEEGNHHFMSDKDIDKIIKVVSKAERDGILELLSDKIAEFRSINHPAREENKDKLDCLIRNFEWLYNRIQKEPAENHLGNCCEKAGDGNETPLIIGKWETETKPVGSNPTATAHKDSHKDDCHFCEYKETDMDQLPCSRCKVSFRSEPVSYWKEKEPAEKESKPIPNIGKDGESVVGIW